MKSSALIKEFMKYGCIGILNTSISLSVIFILMNGLGVSYPIANGIGYGFGLINSFILNKIWTFRSERNIAIELTGFILICMICYFIQLGALILMIEKLNIGKESATVTAMVIYTVLNFIGNKVITFRKK